MSVRIAKVLIVVAAIALVLTSCGGRSTPTGSAADGSTGPRTLEVSLSEFAITPSTIHAPTGVPLSFHVTNDGQAVHTFSVNTGSGVKQTPEIAPGTSAELSVPSLAVGDYTVACTVPGHADLGMRGTLMVMAGTVPSSLGATGSSGGMGMSAQQMASMHQASVAAFPAKTAGSGNRPLKPTIEHGVKVFHLTASEVRWETAPGTYVNAMAYNGQIPGPEIRVGYGDRVEIVVQNRMSQPTVMHLHGMTVPNAMDGVPYITQDPILPGGFFSYDFTVRDPPGVYVYHSHFNSTQQVGEGLYGAVIVEPPEGVWPYRELDVNDRTGVTTLGSQVHVDLESMLFLGDGPLGYVLNGKSFPATSPIVASKGDWVLIHLANDGSMLHPMHLHGYHFEVVAEDGFPLQQPYLADTLVIAPGQRFDVLVHAVHPGVWAFHCHILPHVEGPQGMYGMVTALLVK